MTRVVADTNIFISALVFGGLPGSFLDLAFMRSFQVVTSPILLDELDEKLRLKFGLSTNDADLVRAKLEKNALVVNPGIALKVIVEDPDDDRVLECAVAGKADYIVSGDRHLLKLRSFQGIAIVTAREFTDAAEASI
ncbi:MAG: putative toxin-antitoxin system toxin component, PIN family [Acidobacteriaceae bacterium]